MADDRFELDLRRGLAALLDESGDHPVWLDSPASSRIAGRPARRDSQRVLLLAASIALLLLVAAGLAFVAGWLPPPAPVPTDVSPSSSAEPSVTPGPSGNVEVGPPTVGRIGPGEPAFVYDAEGPLVRITVDRVREVAGYAAATPSSGNVFIEAFVSYEALRPATNEHRINGSLDWQMLVGGAQTGVVGPQTGVVQPPLWIQGGPEPALRTCVLCLRPPGAEPFSGWLVAEVPDGGEVVLSFTRALGEPLFEVTLREGTPSVGMSPYVAADIPSVATIGWLGDRVVVRLTRRDRLRFEYSTFLVDPVSGAWEELPELKGWDGHLATDGRTILAITSGPESPWVRLLAPGQETISPTVTLSQVWVGEWIAAGAPSPEPLSTGGYLLAGLPSLVTVSGDGEVTATGTGVDGATLLAPTSDPDIFVLAFAPSSEVRLWDRRDGGQARIPADGVVDIAPAFGHALAWLRTADGSWSSLSSDGSLAARSGPTVGGAETSISPSGRLIVAEAFFCRAPDDYPPCAALAGLPALPDGATRQNRRVGIVWSPEDAAAWASFEYSPDRVTLDVLVDGAVRRFDPPGR